MNVAANPKCSAEYLASVLSYCPDSGEIRWKDGKYQGNKLAGSVDAGGHLIIQVLKKNYRAGRVAWAIHYGKWPEVDQCVDHIDRNPLNNRLMNLRLATVKENTRNSGIRSTNRSGFKGVSFHYGSWIASITVDGKCKRLGRFETPEEAHAKYVAATKQYFGEFAPSGRMNSREKYSERSIP